MPFGDREFGACFNEHTLEHLHSADDVRLAISECMRVADYAVFLTPSPHSLAALIHPDHRLVITMGTNAITVHINRYRLPTQRVLSSQAH